MDKQQQKFLEQKGIVWQEISKGYTKQPKATYYKPNGEAMPNLPADVDSMKRYLARGLTLVQPEQVQPANVIEDTVPSEPSPQGEFVCEVCGKVFSKKIALIGHLRTHKK